MRRRLRVALLCGWTAAAAACAPALSTLPGLPTGGGMPFADGARVAADATAACSSIRTLTAEVALSGQIDGERVRGRLLVGVAVPDRARLEAPAPFGRPIFTLAMRDGTATLVLNRDKRVIAGARAADVIDALTGVALDAEDFRQVLTGCGVAVAGASRSERHGDGWVRVGTPDAAQWFRQQGGAWRLMASMRGSIEVRYESFAGARPGVIRLRRGAADGVAATDLMLRLSQVETNVDLQATAFDVEVPADAQPMTLDDLRRSGPLGETAAKEPR